MSYTPQADSLAGRVCAFFQIHTDEELSAADIATKFDATRNNIAALLSSCLAHHLLTRAKDEAGIVVYRAGPNLTKLPGLANGAIAAGHNPWGSPPRRAPKTAATASVPLPSPGALVIRKDLPRPQSAAAMKAEYVKVFSRMEVDEGVELSHEEASRLIPFARDYGKTAGRTFSTARIDATRAGIWRNT